jgi:glycosyltransferase involved in cell wall biosynthesis
LSAPRLKPSVELSVVVPVYGCAGCLDELHRRLVASLRDVTDDYELVFVDDCAPDGAWAVLERLRVADPRVRGLRLSRNFGQHAAITAGLEASCGRWVVVMDCDLQDPPEAIGLLYETALQGGYEIVFGRRRARATAPWRALAARMYFRLLNLFTGSRIDGDYGSFSILSSKVVDAFLRVGDHDRHYLLILHWLGFAHTAVDYDHAPRPFGESSYSLGGLLRHAIDGVLFQTTTFLRWIVYLGFGVSAAGAAIAAYLVVAKVTGTAAPGWTSLAVFTLTIGGFIIVSTGTTGLYVGKVFDQVKQRPLYVVDRTLDDAPDAEYADVGAREHAR